MPGIQAVVERLSEVPSKAPLTSDHIGPSPACAPTIRAALDRRAAMGDQSVSARYLLDHLGLWQDVVLR